MTQMESSPTSSALSQTVSIASVPAREPIMGRTTPNFMGAMRRNDTLEVEVEADGVINLGHEIGGNMETDSRAECVSMADSARIWSACASESTSKTRSAQCWKQHLKRVDAVYSDW